MHITTYALYYYCKTKHIIPTTYLKTQKHKHKNTAHLSRNPSLRKSLTPKHHLPFFSLFSPSQYRHHRGFPVCIPTHIPSSALDASMSDSFLERRYSSRPPATRGLRRSKDMLTTSKLVGLLFTRPSAFDTSGNFNILSRRRTVD